MEDRMLRHAPREGVDAGIETGGGHDLGIVDDGRDRVLARALVLARAIDATDAEEEIRIREAEAEALPSPRATTRENRGAHQKTVRALEVQRVARNPARVHDLKVNEGLTCVICIALDGGNPRRNVFFSQYIQLMFGLNFANCTYS